MAAGVPMKSASLSIAAFFVATAATATPSHIPARNYGPARCYWVSGRLSTANGTPTFRIWPKGTKRLLGVTSRSGPLENADVLPHSLRQARPTFDRDVWGDFRVCPLAPDRAGWMRMVILVDARRLIPIDR
jgi:hypothetical protein